MLALGASLNSTLTVYMIIYLRRVEPKPVLSYLDEFELELEPEPNDEGCDPEGPAPHPRVGYLSSRRLFRFPAM